MESQKRTREMLQYILNHPTFRLMSGIVVGQGPDVDISHLTQRGQFAIEKGIALPLEDARVETLPSQMLIDLCTPFREEGTMFGYTLRFPDPIDEILFFGPLVLGQSSHGSIADTLYGLLFGQLKEMLPLRCTWRHRQSLPSSDGNLHEFEEKHDLNTQRNMQPTEHGVDELGHLPPHLHQLDDAGMAEAIVAIDLDILHEHPAAVLRIGA